MLIYTLLTIQKENFKYSIRTGNNVPQKHCLSGVAPKKIGKSVRRCDDETIGSFSNTSIHGKWQENAYLWTQKTLFYGTKMHNFIHRKPLLN